MSENWVEVYEIASNLSAFCPWCLAALRIRSLRMTRKGLAGTSEVFHEPLLKFDGYQFPHAKMPGAKESDPD